MNIVRTDYKSIEVYKDGKGGEAFCAPVAFQLRS